MLHTFRALRHRNFRLFFSGQLISLIGTWMQMVAQPWLVYRLTGSSVLLGAVAFSGQFPVFLFSLVGGYFADHHSRRRILLTTQSCAMVLALVLAGLTLSGQVQVWHLFILSFLLGTVNAFDIPARQSFFYEMVGREDLVNAIALNSSIFNLARVIGPAIAGVLVAWVGEGWCFFFNGISYLAVLAGLLMMRLAPAAARPPSSGALEGIREAFRFIQHHRPIRDLLLLLGLMSIVAMPYAVLMPIFADQVLRRGATGLGMLMSAVGIGALAGALTLARRRRVKGLGYWVSRAAMSFGLGLILFSLSRTYWLSVAFLLPVGMSVMLQMGSSNTLLQSMTPDRLRGRVMAFYTIMFAGMAPVGSLLAGVLADRFGPPMTVAAGGVLALLAGFLFRLRLPLLRQEAHELLDAQELRAGETEVTPGATGAA